MTAFLGNVIVKIILDLHVDLALGVSVGMQECVSFENQYVDLVLKLCSCGNAELSLQSRKREGGSV